MIKKYKTVRWAALLVCCIMVLTLAVLPVGASEHRPTLCVGGFPFGVRFFTDGVLVVGYSDVACGGRHHNPARKAGLAPGDCICEINGEEISSTAELQDALRESGGRELTVKFVRDGVEKSVSLCALRCDEDGCMRMGLLVRDSGAGIGTVTFFHKEDQIFAGLGHGICDGESGKPMPISRGCVMAVRIGSVTRGAVGAPGELCGHFLAQRIGTLQGNTVCGVYGVLSECPESPAGELPIAYRNEVHDGAASVWCTLDDNVPREYSVTLSHIRKNAKGNKCFTVKVTDGELLRRSGGIVQGMSGSPIVQDGRLVGAITHVLIGDPTTGYGIFVENMLANIPRALS